MVLSLMVNILGEIWKENETGKEGERGEKKEGEGGREGRKAKRREEGRRKLLSYK